MISHDTISSDLIEIQAPREFVWDILVDFENYGAWNQFCPRCEADLVLGAPIKMQVDLGFGLQEQTEKICLIQAPEAISWKMDTQPPFRNWLFCSLLSFPGTATRRRR